QHRPALRRRIAVGQIKRVAIRGIGGDSYRSMHGSGSRRLCMRSKPAFKKHRKQTNNSAHQFNLRISIAYSLVGDFQSWLAAWSLQLIPSQCRMREMKYKIMLSTTLRMMEVVSGKNT